MNGDYPFSRFLYVYVNKKPNHPLPPIEREFLKLLLSKQGQAVVEKDGYIPISTLKIEELIHQLKRDYTIVIVTHNMQQAVRVSDNTAFLYLGELIEFGPTDRIFRNPQQKRTEDYITGRYG